MPDTTTDTWRKENHLVPDPEPYTYHTPNHDDPDWDIERHEQEQKEFAIREDEV